MGPDQLHLLTFFLAAGSALLNVILIPLVKSAARGEVNTMVDDHNGDENAHPNLRLSVRSETSLAEFRKEVHQQFEDFRIEIRGLRDEIADLRVALAELGRALKPIPRKKGKG